MMRKIQKLLNWEQKGQVFILALVVLTLVLFSTVGIIGGALTFSQNSRYSIESIKATNLAEAGIDKAVASLNTRGGAYNGEAETFLGGGSYSVAVTSQNSSTYLITSTGYVPNKTNPKAKRTVKIQISRGSGISFVYGILVGNGGITMGNGARINGSVYSNGGITGGNNEVITGDVYVAGGTQPIANQEADCTPPSCSDFIFGKNITGNNQLDAAQSFRPSSTAVINKVSLKLKKVGNPPNVTVRLLGDLNGKPNKDNVKTSGTLYANLVTNQYGFVDITFISSPLLSADTPYWIIADSSSDKDNYWLWSSDSLQSYTRGSSAWSPDWQHGNPIWNSNNVDLGFKVWMGGVIKSITMGNGSVVNGHVHANTINGVTIDKDAYYQTILNSTVRGTSYPNSTDPVPIAMPISEANINQWKADAEGLNVSTGNVSGCPSTLGPGKIVGNVTIGNNCTVTVSTPIWITGNLVFGNTSILRMDPSLGSVSGAVIVDGISIFSNSDDLIGTGAQGSYLTLLSTHDSSETGQIAIDTGNSAITGILYAPNGQVTLSNNATFKEVVAESLIMGTGTVLTYDSGLISTFFSAGPSGSFSVIKGTYQAD
jgi:hypothetical protein